jgi:peroxiredoxin
MVLMGSNDGVLNNGDNAPNFKLKSTDGNFYSLEEVKGEKLTLVVFICNHCPYVIPRLGALNKIAQDFESKGVKVIGINPNESVNYPEDSFDNMKKMVDNGKIKFKYLHDESQDVAKSYGAVCTPDPFLFDENLNLIFHSRITDAKGDEQDKVEEMYDAISNYLDTRKISIVGNPSFGCSIKWKYD